MISQFESADRQDVASLAVPVIGESIVCDNNVTRLEFPTVAVSQKIAGGERVGEQEHSMPLEEKTAQGDFMASTGAGESHAEELEAAARRGRDEGNLEAATELQCQLEVERTKVLKITEQFRMERERYFQAVENQVVKLALAVAQRILHREVNLDPVVLQGVVKVALEKLADSTGTIVRVPETDVAAWLDRIRSDDTCKVEVRGDARLMAGECVLETEVGRVELGIAAQLEEIEKGFFDLLQQRPA